jgi:S1/P1 Nuclease
MNPRNLLKSIVLVAAVVILTASSRAFAWIDTGHRIVSLVAWADLTPAAKSAISQILQQHPRYKQDLLNGLPDGADQPETDRFAFEIASTWPDLVRSYSNPMHAAYNHPNWHYIDIPYCLGGVTPHVDPDTRPGPHNVIEALTKNTADLRSPGVAAKDKAIALCWVLHLCGDIHQPLHCVSLFSPQFPNGDQGGNALFILRDPPYPDSRMKLHLLWDELPGQYKNEEVMADFAAGLRLDPRYSRTALKDAIAVTDFATWANESHDLAIHYAYRNGTLAFSTGQQESLATGDDQPLPPGLPPGYLKEAEDVAMTRVVLAGYRMADLLNSIFDSK